MVYSIINLGFLHWYEGIGEIRVSKSIRPLALSAFVQGKIRLIVSLIVYNWFHKMTLNYFPSLCRCLEKLRNKHSLKLQVVLCWLGKVLFTLTCLSKKFLGWFVDVNPYKSIMLIIICNLQLLLKCLHGQLWHLNNTSNINSTRHQASNFIAKFDILSGNIASVWRIHINIYLQLFDLNNLINI